MAAEESRLSSVKSPFQLAVQSVAMATRHAGVPSSLPNVIGIGAMKAATSAVHECLDAHPHIRMSSPKELNFFNGPEPNDDAELWWVTGQWHRGVDWYAGHFDPHNAARRRLGAGFAERVSDDVDRLREFLGDDLQEWA